MYTVENISVFLFILPLERGSGGGGERNLGEIEISEKLLTQVTAFLLTLSKLNFRENGSAHSSTAN